jgi:hypothetical protein
MSIKSRSRRTNKKRSGARTKAHDRRLLAQASKEEEEGAPFAPDPMLLTGATFMNLEEATPADLIRLMFEAPNGSGNHTDPDAFLSDFLLTVTDDAALMGAGVECPDGMFGDEVSRVALRVSFRTKAVMELVRRMKAAVRTSSEVHP